MTSETTTADRLDDARRDHPVEVGAWVAGEWLRGEETIRVREPYRGDLAATVFAADDGTVASAVQAAATTLADGVLPVHERAAVLRRAADLVDDRKRELAETITRQTGKVVKDTLREVGRVPWTLRAAATAAETCNGKVFVPDAIPFGVGVTAFSYRKAVGIVAAITPFNAPLNLVAHKVAPAIAAGNTVVVKPASAAPLSALQLTQILEEAGLPPGTVNVIPGGVATAEALLRHPKVALVTFTGGPVAGEAVRRAAGFRKVLLELGGNSPNIVHSDADLELAADACVRGGFSNGGQSCNSVQRILVHRDVREEFTALLLAAVAALRTGDPLDPETDVGPVIDARSAARVIAVINDAVADGARVLTGAERAGNVIAPTVLADVKASCSLFGDEIFAPVVLINAYDELHEAIEMANRTHYGLQAAVFTSNWEVAFTTADRLKAGGVMVNRSSNFRLDHLPYGGIAESGVGREGPAAAVREMTEEKLVVLAPGGL